ncbi:hypothetical protein ACFQL1_09770 [Halomicroarcula sp. GCM10025709]|uniref:hypothetical protein n=1 Tax=Haloarcula TaxID=2237 RepID=UPI0024C29F42|nr:hypothetical protein [Halomicroarcula sp. YJ-61-S]
MTEPLSESLADAFAESTDEETAAEAGEQIAEFVADYERDLTAEALLDRFAEAPYDDFAHRYDWLVGELAAETEDCTDSRAYRLDGFGDLAADPTQGA